MRESYYQVERSAVKQAGQTAQEDWQKMEEAGKELQNRNKEVSAAESVFRDRLSQLHERYPQMEPPDLTKADLDLEKERQQGLSRKLAGSIRQLDEEIELTGKQLDDYQRAAESLKQMDVAVSETTVPLPREQEQEQLLGRAYEEVAQSRHEENERSAQLDKAKRQAVERLQLCQDELNLSLIHI